MKCSIPDRAKNKSELIKTCILPIQLDCQAFGLDTDMMHSLAREKSSLTYSNKTFALSLAND
jgi:hypothetical protein